MIARAATRAQLRRPTVRAIVVVAAALGWWFAWSPGTRFGLGGVYGGWRFASPHLLDVGLVPVVLVGALAGAAPRERRVDEQLRATGVTTVRIVRGVTASGALLALAVSAGFALGAAGGGLTRSVTNAGSWWADPGASSGVVDPLLTDGRVLLAAALAGAGGALIGWLARREDLAAALAVVLTLGYLPELSAVLRRLPVVIDLLAATPMGALRATALANRGLAAEGFGEPASPLRFAIVLAAWFGLLVAVAVPAPPRRHRRDPTDRLAPGDESRRPHRRVPAVRPAILALVVGATVATVGFGATAPGRAADALPWRWQRSWRAAERAGWSSPQTVDRYVEAVRATPAGDGADLLVAPGVVPSAVTESVRRASRVERQPVAAMATPGYVVLRLDFDEPVVSGSVAFSAYLVRFALQSDPDQRWHIAGAEGPVAEAAAVVDAQDGPP